MFVDALASNDSERFPEMLEVSEEGSPAHAFAVHLTHVAAVFASDSDRPSTLMPGTWEVRRDTVTIAYGPDPDQSRGYANFETDPRTERLTSFSESQPADSPERVPIADTIVAGDGAPVPVFDATVELLSARRPSWSPQLAAILEVRSGDRPLRINAEAQPLVTAPRSPATTGAVTTYVTAAGEKQALHDVFGATDVAPHSTSVLLLVFEDVGFGGTIVLPIGSEGDLIEAEIPVGDAER